MREQNSEQSSERMVLWAAVTIADLFKAIRCPFCRDAPGKHLAGCPLMPPLLGIELWQQGDSVGRSGESLDRDEFDDATAGVAGEV